MSNLKIKEGVVLVDKETVQEWTPALENFFGAQLANISPSKKELLVAIAAKTFDGNHASFTAATESVGFVQLNGNNSQMARSVQNPVNNTNQGLTANNGGTSGSGDPQFLIGLCLALAAKTVGLELVQHIPASSQNVTIDYLVALYNGGEVDNPKNNKVFVVTAEFDKVPTLTKTIQYGFLHKASKTIVTASFAKQAREIKKGLIFELKNKLSFEAIDDATGALTDVAYEAAEGLGTYLKDSELVVVADDLTKVTKVAVDGVEVTIKSVDNTKAVENYVPHQTTNGLRRTLSRNEADKGTERSMALDYRSEGYTVGNRVFTGHVGRLQLKRLTEQGKDPLTFLSASMLNELSQEVNYQILSAARALGITNALAFQGRGTSFNTFFGPTNVTQKAFSALKGADELVGMDGASVANDFVAIPNLRAVMQYETIASLGAAICMLIKQACTAIGTDSRYGDGNAVVLASNLGGYVAAASLFTELKQTNSVNIDSRTGAKLAGYIGDIKVYIDVMIDEASPFVTVLRDNKEVTIDMPGFEEQNIIVPGLAYIVKDIVSSVEIIPENTGGRKVIMDSETELVAVGDNPEKGYLTFAVDVQIPGLSMAKN